MSNPNDIKKNHRLNILIIGCILAIVGQSLWGRQLLRAMGQLPLTSFYLLILIVIFVTGVLWTKRVISSAQLVAITALLTLFAALVQLRVLPPEEITHLFNFGLLGLLLGRYALLPALGTILLVSTGDELLQGLLSYRVGHWRDVLLNVVCGTSGYLVAHLGRQHIHREP